MVSVATALVFPHLWTTGCCSVITCMGNLCFHALSQCSSLLPWLRYISGLVMSLSAVSTKWLLAYLFVRGFPYSFIPAVVCTKRCWMLEKLRQNKAPESLPMTWPPPSGNSDYRRCRASLLQQHFASNAARIVFAVCTWSWNFLLQTCSCEKGWQIRCVLQWFPATVGAQVYILGWQNHKALSKH